MTEREREMMALALRGYYLLKQQHDAMEKMTRDLLEGLQKNRVGDALLYQLMDSLDFPQQGERYQSLNAESDPFTTDGIYQYSRGWIRALFRDKVQQGTSRELEEFIDHLIEVKRKFEAEAKVLPPTRD